MHTCLVCTCLLSFAVLCVQAEQKMKNFMGEDEEKELSFPKLVKVYRAIL